MNNMGFAQPKIGEYWKIEYSTNINIVRIIGHLSWGYQSQTIYSNEDTPKTSWTFDCMGVTYTKLNDKEIEYYLAKAL